MKFELRLELGHAGMTTEKDIASILQLVAAGMDAPPVADGPHWIRVNNKTVGHWEMTE